MAQTLDEEWTRMRGMEIQAVGIASITYDEESQNLINLRNRGAMMSDPSIREGYVQTTIAEGLKNAGSNDSGAMAGFMGMGMGMQMGGGFMGRPAGRKPVGCAQPDGRNAAGQRGNGRPDARNTAGQRMDLPRLRDL